MVAFELEETTLTLKFKNEDDSHKKINNKINENFNHF